MSSDQGGEPQLQEEAEPGPKTLGEDETALRTGGNSGAMVTSKGAGLNPNAKVWQEAPTVPGEVPVDGPDVSPWAQTGIAADPGCKAYTPGILPPVDGEGPTPAAIDGAVNGMDPPGVGYPTSDPAMGSSAEERGVEEALRESLRKELELCFSRENLSKDLYLMSQMDSDQFVPIWTIASMEGIKVLTSDMELIVDVLRSSPMVQVDEKGERVRPNHKRCIIILREVPETTPVEEVEALFKSESCPRAVGVEFAHNNNWYITFQSDTDAQQAYRYLREEVKTFQGKPIMARIKAINTFFAKNGYRTLECGVYAQPAQSQSQFSSALYMQPVYTPPQQYPLYGLVPPAWTPPPTPYFETPLAPFPNTGFVNGFSSGHYKTSPGSLAAGRPFSRNRVPLYSRKNVISAFRNHVKPQARGSDGAPCPVAPVPPLVEGLTGLRSPQPHPTGPPSLTSDLSTTFPPLTSSETSEDGSMGARGRRSSYRGTRRRRDDERATRLLPLTEVKAPQPKFDLAASNFPPLPGSTGSPQGEPVLENRLSDVVRGLNRDKQAEVKESVSAAPAPEERLPKPAPPAAKPGPQPEPPVPSTTHQEKKLEKAEPPVHKEIPATHVTPAPATATQTTPGPKPLTGTAPQASPAPLGTPSLEPRKLSYAEVCQRPPKDPPPASPAPAASGQASQPLRELRVNKADEPSPGVAEQPDRPQERTGDCKGREGSYRPSREPQGPYRSNGASRATTGGLKLREQQRRPPLARRGSPQGPRHTGKEQNIPPISPK